MLAVLSVVLALGSPAAPAADKSPPTELERRVCEGRIGALAELMGSSERASDFQVEQCADSLREERAKYRMDEAHYERWLRCQSGSANLLSGPCVKLLREMSPGKVAGSRDAIVAADKQRARAVLGMLEPYRDEGFISSGNYREIERASQDGKHGSLADVFGDAYHLLESGRVRRGTKLAIYPHEGVGSRSVPPRRTGERAADLAFVDARTGQRVVRFAHVSGVALMHKLDNGELASALAWVAEKPEARSVEVAVFTSKDDGAHVLLSADGMKAISKLATHLPGALAKRPLLFQGKTTVSYERWLDLGARFHQRGLDGKDPDVNTLAKMVTLDDLETILR